MTDSGPPADPREIFENVDEALQGLELEPHETSQILSFANDEVPHLQTPETSYFILGSYRDPYIRRLRIVENELNKRLGTYPFLMGDLREIDLDRLPVFRIRFTLLAAYTDYIVAVYEQGAGGEVTELGKISTTPYFEKSFVLPRDYTWMTDKQLESPADVLTAAINIRFNDDLDEVSVEEELESLLTQAQQNGIEISRQDIDERLQTREQAEEEAVSYSWVHLNEFRLFELHNQCLPWSDPDELREITQEVP
ncbi:hypothetical protein SAMN04487947_2597 [Halogeometricum rufum]|uniref:Uncharacterized protein n=1 Tax=Halogeometricum rufum TaxID=553469 RepID=A0A1I6HXF1_9EURY|nr:hypothetical protein [Halogeometricum rufum]SFR58900.1 hypothetical protein SAMN04487947_2597 [Halogeometricum rufum]